MKAKKENLVSFPSVKCGGPDDQMFRLIRDLVYLSHMEFNPSDEFFLRRDQIKYYAVALAREWDPEKYIKTIVKQSTTFIEPQLCYYDDDGEPCILFKNGAQLPLGLSFKRDNIFSKCKDDLADSKKKVSELENLVSELRMELSKRTPKKTTQQLRAAKKAISAAHKVFSAK